MDSEWSKQIEELSAKRKQLCKHIPMCPNCYEPYQIQLKEWVDKVEWKCRICKHTWRVIWAGEI